MCGIFGAVSSSTLGASHMRFNTQAFQVGQLRGLHGTGAFVAPRDKGGAVSALSLAITGTEFIHDDRGLALIRGATGAKAFVGHNRHTTSGKNVDDHCHPFQFGEITGVHNGGVPHGVLNEIDPDNSHPVDSGRVYAALSKVDDPIEVLTKISSGAYALVWYDARNHSLYMARNGSRPLHVVDTSSGLYFASELHMLSWLLSRNSTVTGGKSDFGLLDTETLYRIPLDATDKVEATPYTPDKPTPAPQITYPYPSSGGSYMDPYREYYRVPERLTRRVYSTDLLRSRYPAMGGAADEIEGLIEVKSNLVADLYVALAGIGRDNLGEDCAYGFLCGNPSGPVDAEIPVMGHIPVTLRVYNESSLKVLYRFIKEADNDYPYPIVRGKMRSIIVRPDGSAMLSGSPAYPLPSGDSMTYVQGMGDSAESWIKDVISAEHLEDLDTTQLQQCWSSLEAPLPAKESAAA